VTTFTDDFNRADSTNLGANWVEVSGDWSIISNQLSSGSAGGTIILRAAGAMATNDNSAQVTIAVTASVSHGVWCRGNSNITSGYLWRNDGSSWNLFSVVGGSFTSIGSFAGAAVAGDVAKVQAVGSTIKGFVNGIQRVSVTDTNVPTGTSVGIRAESVSALRFDDFTGADVTSGVTGDAALSGTATLTATGLRGTSGVSALTATAALAATGVRGAVDGAAIAAAADLAADGVRGTSGTTALDATADLHAAGTVGTAGDTTLNPTADLAADGTVGHPGHAAIAATAGLAASGLRNTLADASLTGTAELAAQGHTGRTGSTALAATALLTASGAIAATGHAALTATATLTASRAAAPSEEDVDVTVGAPYSPWTAGQPNAPAWNTEGPQDDGWEASAPW